jgi:hypothetical protein
MAAVAHGWKPSGVDVPVKVAKKFNKADTGTKMLARAAALRRKG